MLYLYVTLLKTIKLILDVLSWASEMPLQHLLNSVGGFWASSNVTAAMKRKSWKQQNILYIKIVDSRAEDRHHSVLGLSVEIHFLKIESGKAAVKLCCF